MGIEPGQNESGARQLSFFARVRVGSPRRDARKRAGCQGAEKKGASECEELGLAWLPSTGRAENDGRGGGVSGTRTRSLRRLFGAGALALELLQLDRSQGIRVHGPRSSSSEECV